MKITANRKEDILRRKAEWEADRDRRQAEHDEQYENFRRAQDAVYAPVRDELEALLAKYPRLETEVTVEDAPFRQKGLEVRIRVNDRDVHDPKKALSWDYRAFISDGEVQRETGSWSGLQATTAEQLEHLEQSLGALKELANLDWMSILDKTLPEYRDYITTDDPRYDRDKPDFNKELQEAEIEDIIGQRKMIEVRPFSSSWYSNGNSRWDKNVFIAILKDSGSQYTIKECPLRAYENGEATKYFDDADQHRVKKSAIKLADPINIIDV